MSAQTTQQPADRTIHRVLGRVLWVVNVLALVGLCGWIASDGRFTYAAAALRFELNHRLAGNWSEISRALPPDSRVLALKILGVLAITSIAGIFVSLFVGARAHRRVRSWLAFTLLIAAWLTLAVSWQELAWHGQVVRARFYASGLEPVAASLRADWPVADSERPELGPFTAYPQGKPTMLMLLTPPNLVGTNAIFVAVERSSKGALRFQLADSEPDAWLEWHPAGSAPQSFRGGLSTNYRLARSAPLGNGWYLIRYRNRL